MTTGYFGSGWIHREKGNKARGAPSMESYHCSDRDCWHRY
jgi:hypothetical protein